MLVAISVERSMANPAAELLAAVADAAGKLYPDGLEKLGVSRRGRLTARSGHPLRELADQTAAILGVDSFELFVHERIEPLVSVEMTEPPSVVVAPSVMQMRQSEQVFVLAYALSAICGRFYPALRLREPELELLLVAAARSMTEAVSTTLADDEILNEHAQRVKRAVPRRWRRIHETASLDFASSGTDYRRWRASLLQTAYRAALLLSDDLPGAVKIVRRIHSLTTDGAELVEQSSIVADLLHFWTSDQAMAVRKRTGM